MCRSSNNQLLFFNKLYIYYAKRCGLVVGFERYLCPHKNTRHRLVPHSIWGQVPLMLLLNYCLHMNFGYQGGRFTTWKLKLGIWIQTLLMLLIVLLKKEIYHVMNI